VKRVVHIPPSCEAHDLVAHQPEHEPEDDVQALGTGESGI
jgi:hypothetical protein